MIYRSFNTAGKFPFLGLLIMGLFLFVIFLFLRAIFILLYYLTPVLIILILVFDAKVILNHIKYLGKKIKDSPVSGLIQTGLSILFLPILLVYLLFQALINRQFKKNQMNTGNNQTSDWADFEELESQIPIKKADPRDLV